MQPHDILGVALDADLETIKRAYFELAKTMHPDAGGSDKEFVRLHAAYEAMAGGWKAETTTRQREPEEQPKREERKSARRKKNQWKPEDRKRREWRREERTREDNQNQPFVDIMEEARERLERETAQRLAEGVRPKGASMAGFWVGLFLTPACAGAIGTCFCYDGKPFERPLWSFSFAVAIVILLYTGGLAAAMGTCRGTNGPTVYRRVVILISIVALLIAFPWSMLQNPDAQPNPLISRNHVPSWWPKR